jgi:CDP-diacylglycerol--glycerol-3-phosphate 3-phosphatidyltransferase
LLRPLVRRLAAAGVTANQVTLAAALGSVMVRCGCSACTGHHTLFVLLTRGSARMALNTDGMLAREFGQKSRLGGYLNEQ